MSIVALFDMSGHSVRDWAAAGYKCYCLDIINDGRIEKFPSGGSIMYLQWDAHAPNALNIIYDLSPQFILSFPPCTDLAVSGAKHFASKRLANPNYLKEAIDLVMLLPSFAERVAGVPWAFENPVGVISTEWRKPDAMFDPYDFAGYLPVDDAHPQWPQYIASRDRYRKKTCLWYGNGFKFPSLRPLPYMEASVGFNAQTAKLGGKSQRTKQIRSLTPRGFARAVFEANSPLVPL